MAGALNLVGSHAAFGRNWGCIHGERYPGLHMELCYYQALEFAIQVGASSARGRRKHGPHSLESMLGSEWGSEWGSTCSDPSAMHVCACLQGDSFQG